MAWEQPILDVSFEAAEDLSGDQFHFVVLDTTSKKVRRPDSAVEPILGVLQNKPAAGQSAQVRTDGFSKIKAGAGGLAMGSLVKPEYIGAADAGKGIVATTAATIGQPYAYGRVVEGCDAEDEIATIKMGIIALPTA